MSLASSVTADFCILLQRLSQDVMAQWHSVCSWPGSLLGYPEGCIHSGTWYSLVSQEGFPPHLSHGLHFLPVCLIPAGIFPLLLSKGGDSWAVYCVSWEWPLGVYCLWHHGISRQVSSSLLVNCWGRSSFLRSWCWCLNAPSSWSDVSSWVLWAPYWRWESCRCYSLHCGTCR